MDNFVSSTGETVKVISMREAAKVWNSEEAVEFFRAQDHSKAMPLIVVREEAKGGWFSSAPKPLSYFGSKEDLELPFLVAQIDYDPECREHWQMLSTLYTFFISGDNGPELSTSRNWERLGFQGSDPRTDLNRSMKMLSVLQVCTHSAVSNYLFILLFFLVSCRCSALSSWIVLVPDEPSHSPCQTACWMKPTHPLP